MKNKRWIVVGLCVFSIAWLTDEVYEQNQQVKIEQQAKREQQQLEYKKQQEQAERERASKRAEVSKLLSTDPEEALTIAVNWMTGYSDLISMIGQPTKLRRSVNGADLATWRFGDYQLFVSEKRKGETKVYAFKDDVKDVFVERTFSRMLIQ